MLRFVFAILIGLCSAVSAYSQSLVIINQPPYSGTAIGSGYDVGANGPLYAPTSASLQSLTLPFSYSFDFIGAPGYFTPFPNSSTYLLGGQPPGGVVGFNAQQNDGVLTDTFRGMNVLKPAGSSAACDGGSSGNMCWRPNINDGTRHNWCTVWTPTHGYFYIDGILRDETTNVGTFNVGTGTWEIGNSPGNVLWPVGTKFFDVRAYNRALTADECVQLQNLQQANLIPSAGSLTQGLVVNWPLNNCVVTGLNYSCADASGNGNTMDNDKNPPVVVITSPSPGPVSGTTVSMQSTCTDIFPCTQVCYYMDGVLISTTCPTTAPTFTFSWDSTKAIDGAHTLTATATNTGGVTGTSAGVAVTTSNSVSPKTVYVDSVSGLDTNNCLTTGTACKTLAHIQSAITFLGGDTLALLQGDTFTDTAVFQICGPLSGCATRNFYPSSSTFTITTYGGGTCNPFALTATGCATIQVSGASTYQAIVDINATNLTFNNLVVAGGTAAAFGFCEGDGGGNGEGIASYANANTISGITSNITIQNSWVHDFSCGITFNMGQESSPITNFLVENSVVSGATAASPITQAVRAGSNTQGTVQGSLAFNIGGGSEQGNCFMFANYPSPPGASSSLAQFNVCHDFGGSNQSAGGPIGIYAINANLVKYQFNESYRGYPPGYPGSVLAGSFDYDCYDIDTGSTNITMEYNYAHDCPIQSAFNIVADPGAISPANPNWTNNVYRYNIGENTAACAFIGGDTKATSSYIYNNSCATNVTRGTFVTTAPVCWNTYSTGLVFANNLCIWTGTGPATYVNMVTPNESTLLNNDYWSTTCVLPSCTMTWTFNAFGAPAVTYTTLSAYQNASGYDANSLNVNPQISGTPGTGGTCWGGGTTPPAGPQPCPSVYQLTTGSPLIGAGLDLTQAPYSQSVGTRDYYGNAIPNGVGTGYNIGADGAHH